MTATILTDCPTCAGYRRLLALEVEARANVKRSLRLCRDRNANLQHKLRVRRAALEEKTNG